MYAKEYQVKRLSEAGRGGTAALRDWLGEAKAKQVYLVLRDRILSGAIVFGTRLPTENELAEVHDVSRVTVRRALGELARERLIERRRSTGTRVIYRPVLAPMTADISGMLASLADMGRRTAVKLLSFGYVPAEGPVAQALGVPSDQMLQRSVRVRAVDGEPFSYLTTHVPESVSLTFTRQDLASKPLLDLLERAGVKVEQARQRISAGLATPDVAAALNVRTGSPLIELTRVCPTINPAAGSSTCTPFTGLTAMASRSTSSAQASGIKRGRPFSAGPARPATRPPFQDVSLRGNRRTSGRRANRGSATMSDRKFPLSRRRFLASTALGAASAAAGSVAMPSVLRAAAEPVKLGVLHPVTGALSYSGQQGRLGATMAIDEINAAGGIKALGGAKIDPVLGDAQSTPDGGTAEVEKMNSAGVSCIVGGYASNVCLATTQAAARYDLPYVVDVGVADTIVTRGLKNTFRFGPGFGVIAKTALANLVAINDGAGKPAKTVVIVHEDSLFGSGLAKLLNAQLPDKGFQVLDTIPHPTPTRDFNTIVLKIKAQNPDLVIPANYYNEYVLLARTMLQQHVRPKAIYSVLGGAASSYKFVKEFPDAAKYIMDCNHWFNPLSDKAQALKKQVEANGQFFTYEVYLNYSCVGLIADALERAGSAERPKIISALENST